MYIYAVLAGCQLCVFFSDSIVCKEEHRAVLATYMWVNKRAKVFLR